MSSGGCRVNPATNKSIIAQKIQHHSPWCLPHFSSLWQMETDCHDYQSCLKTVSHCRHVHKLLSTESSNRALAFVDDNNCQVCLANWARKILNEFLQRGHLNKETTVVFHGMSTSGSSVCDDDVIEGSLTEW